MWTVLRDYVTLDNIDFNDIPISDSLLRDTIYQVFRGKCLTDGFINGKKGAKYDHGAVYPCIYIIKTSFAPKVERLYLQNIGQIDEKIVVNQRKIKALQWGKTLNVILEQKYKKRQEIMKSFFIPCCDRVTPSPRPPHQCPPHQYKNKRVNLS